uniref:Rpn family recombination-promoting nuclease/putative transposase n=1 Tax=Desulfacinum infernum TaxID=35837 RepID=A0A832EKS6_9BACT
MGGYDAAMKVILAHCRQAALEFFLGLDVAESELLELPQETASVRRSDFPIRVRVADGRVFIVLLEVQSRWEAHVPLRLLEYDARYRLKTGLSVLPVVMLLTPSGSVVECFEDESIRYRFRVISLAAMDAREVVNLGNPCLMPFVGLMRGGSEIFQMAEEAIYGSALARSDKADLLTGMALLSGLVDKDLPRRLLERRRDIIMESYAYELIKKEGYEEGVRSGIQQGMQQGIQQGMQQGIQQGMQQGTLEATREHILETLEARFMGVPKDIFDALRKIHDPDTLKFLFKKALRADSLDEFRKTLTSFLD